MYFLKSFGDLLLCITTPIVLGAGVLLTFKTRFVQVRKLPHMFCLLFSMLFNRHSKKEGGTTVRAHRALFTAMSTTIGISTIVSPVIAIRLGGPGAVLGFVIATLLGAAVNFTEVTFALSYRQHHPEKGVSGGPMQYLQAEVHPFLAKWYAFFGAVLLLGWSAAQANQLGAILTAFAVPSWTTGLFLALSVTAILIGGIKRVSSFSAKLVPAMFLLYVGGALWIICANYHTLFTLLRHVFESALAPQSFATGVTVGGIGAALRWGVFKGLQSNEAGVGTQTIPHSMAETENPVEQGILSMVATYSAGFICILSSLVTLITQSWLDPTLSLGINMVAASFQSYFSTLGLLIVAASALLFAFGTVLGNSFNGAQCFGYITKQRFTFFYYGATALLIFIGSLVDAAAIWAFIDYLLVPVVLPHILSIIYLSYKEKEVIVIA